MPNLADYQSIFQLGAGLAIGFSGILSIFDEPIESETRKLNFLGKRVRALRARFPDLNQGEIESIDTLEKEIDSKIDEIQKDKNEKIQFAALKIGALIISILCMLLLIQSSDAPNEHIGLVRRSIGMVALAFTPIAAFYVAWEYRKIKKGYGAQRLALDNRYVTCVDSLMATR